MGPLRRAPGHEVDSEENGGYFVGIKHQNQTITEENMKIIFINPSSFNDSGRDLYSAHIAAPLFTFQPNTKMTLGIPLALPTLAAVTPSEFELKIIDEEIEDIDFDEPADIVAITAMTFKAKRAYEIAREFRARGVKVIMGGIHASMCPDEVSEHVDCVVVGEAENIWPSLLIDAVEGKLKKRYVGQGLPDLKISRTPRYDLVKIDQYLYAYLQTTRGCPFDCTFCTVTKMSGRTVRKKTPEQVIEDVSSIINLKHKQTFDMIDRMANQKMKVVKMIAFIDDNFAIDRKHALAICHALKRFQMEHNVAIPWYTQTNVEVGFDEELLTAMSAANCQHLFIGFESLDMATLQSMQKNINSPERYEEAIQNIHNHGIRVVFSTIIGDDNTSRQSAEYLKAFIEKNNILHVLLNILTPYPGTKLFEEMTKEGRILTDQSELYNIRNVVFKPRNMAARELQELFNSLSSSIYQYDNMYKRGENLFKPASRLYFSFLDRVLIWIGLSFTSLYLVCQGKLRIKIALRILIKAPYLILFHGSLFAIELLAISADYDDFAHCEAKRLKEDKN